MLSRVLELKERFINAATQEEKNAIDEAMQELIKENPNAWAEAMVESAKRTADKSRVRQFSEHLASIPYR